jgi:hypothetical protein
MVRPRVTAPALVPPSEADLDRLLKLLPTRSGLYGEQEIRGLLRAWFQQAAQPEPPGEATQVGPELKRIAQAARALRDVLREGPRGRGVLVDHLDALAEGDAELGVGLLRRMTELQEAVHYLAQVATRAERQWKQVQKHIRSERRHELQALEELCRIFQDVTGREAAVSKSEEVGYRGAWLKFAAVAARLAWTGRAKAPTELIMYAARNVRGL